MRTGRDHAAQADPTRNPNFSRTWDDNPLALPGFRHLDREIGLQAVEDVGRRAIYAWLNKASDGHGAAAAQAFRQADAIRRSLGLEWADLSGQRTAA